MFNRGADLIRRSTEVGFGVQEVTKGEFKEFVDATARPMSGCTTYDGTWQAHADRDWNNLGYPQTASHPVACVSWRDAQANDDPSQDPYAQPNKRRTLGIDKLPTNQGVFVGSFASVAQMLDEMATVPGVRGVMLTFDDFVVGMEQFGTRILPLMQCRDGVKKAA